MQATTKKTDNRKRSTDFALNVMFVLCNIANGDGGTEASRPLGFLGLPNDATMETRTFQITEERIAPVIWKVYNGTLEDNLKEEVGLSTDRNKFVLWLKSTDFERSLHTGQSGLSFG